MTRDEHGGQKQHNDGGDIRTENTGLTDQEAAQLGAHAGRGARQEPGAQPSDEYVQEHVTGGNTGPDVLDVTEAAENDQE